MPRFVIQGVGYLGLAAFVVSYQTRSNKKLYLIQLAGVLLFTLQFALLGAYSGCLSLALTAVRNSMLSKYGEWPWVQKKIWPALLLLGFTAVLFFTWAGPSSLLAWTASVVSTLCYWTNNARTLRAANLFVSSPCWLVYDFIAGSWGGFVNEAFTLVSILVSIARFGWKALGGPQPGNGGK